MKRIAASEQIEIKDIYLRTLLIILRTLEVSPKEFFADPYFNGEDLDIDFK